MHDTYKPDYLAQAERHTASGIDHFVWNAIPSPECMGPLIPVTLTAKDANNGQHQAHKPQGARLPARCIWPQ